MNKHLKYLIPLLFALAVLFGLIQRKSDPYVGYNKKSFFSKQNPADDKSLKDYYEISQQMAKQNDTKTSASFLAVGDIMLSRNVAAVMDKAQNSFLPYQGMKNILKSTDFNFGNLESPFYKISKTCVTSEATGIIGGHSMIFGAPCLYIKGLRDYNFQVLNLANNHALDQGLEGLHFTTSLLSDPNIAIQHTGVGQNLEEAWKPKIVETKGIKICFIGASYASINDNGKTTNNFVARINDITRLKSAIRNAQSACNFIIATMHAGTEYTRKPNQAQIDFARAAIDYGADMVIGSHPHWIQTLEKYNGKYIFYSLGNFIFDQMWSADTREGLAIKMTISKNGNCHPGSNASAAGGEGLSGIQKIDFGYPPSANSGMTCNDDLQGTRMPATLESIELIPVIIENYSTPRPANEQETKNILQKINQKEKILYP